MLKHQLQIALRNLINRKHITVINILGMSVGLTIFIMINLYLNNQWNHDSFQENRNRIYRIESEFGGITAGAVAPYLAQKHPQIEQFTRLVTREFSLKNPESKHTKEVYSKNILIADPSVTKIFTFDFILGNPHNAIETKDQIAISEKLARKLFGNTSPLGKILIANSTYQYRVSAVFRDLPSNSMLKAQALINIKYLNEYWKTPNHTERWNNWSYESYLLFPENLDVEQITPALAKDFRKGYNATEAEIEEYPFTLAPFTEIYFRPVMDWWNHGNKNSLILLSIISLFILLIACINFINITTAYAGQRAKEIGLKKVVGAEPIHLRKQFLIETLLFSYISIFISITLTELLLPFYSTILKTEITISYTLGSMFLLLVVLPLLMSFMAGFYPAVLLSSFNVSEVLKGKYTKGKRSEKLRKTLTIAQFSISIFLLIVTIGLYKQMVYTQEKDTGFQKRNLIYIPSNDKINNQFNFFSDRLKESPNIQGISRINQPIENVQEFWGVKTEENHEKNSSYRCLWVDSDFLDVIQIKLIRGRNFNKGIGDLDKAMLINECFANKHFPHGAIGQRVNDIEVIGVVKDFNFNSIHTKIEPITITYSHRRTRFYAIRITENQIKNTINFIEEQWNNISPEYPFIYSFLEEEIRNLYSKDNQYMQLFLIFSTLAIFLACLGLFAMASFIAERKTKEIGIRKVLGASAGKIVLILSKEFAICIVIANMIAWPAAWYFLKRWLDNFAYRIEIQWYFFILGTLLAFAIAIATIISHTLKTAYKNPVLSLKYE